MKGPASSVSSSEWDSSLETSESAPPLRSFSRAAIFLQKSEKVWHDNLPYEMEQINSLTPKQNGQNLTYNTVKWILLKEYFCILSQV